MHAAQPPQSRCSGTLRQPPLTPHVPAVLLRAQFPNCDGSHMKHNKVRACVAMGRREQQQHSSSSASAAARPRHAATNSHSHARTLACATFAIAQATGDNVGPLIVEKAA